MGGRIDAVTDPGIESRAFDTLWTPAESKLAAANDDDAGIIRAFGYFGEEQHGDSGVEYQWAAQWGAFAEYTDGDVKCVLVAVDRHAGCRDWETDDNFAASA